MRWRMLAMLFAARVGLGLQFQTLGSVGDELIVDFGLDYAQIGLLIGLFMAPGLVLALPAGYAGRYASDKGLAVSGLLALAIGGLVSGGASDSWTIGLGRVMAGAGFLLINLYFTKMVADWFVGREIATAMSILVMSWPFGIAMGQIGHAWLSAAYGWRLPFQMASGYCLLAAIGLFACYRPPGVARSAADGSAARLTGMELRLILCAGTAWGVFNAGYVTYLSFGPKVLESQGYTALKAAGVISVASWLMIAAGTLCGQIADRLGARNTILAICMTGAVLALTLLGVPRAGLAASLLFGLVGMAPAGIIMALAGEAMRPEQRAFGMGLFFTVYYAIMMAAPPIAGALLDGTGSPRAAIVFAMALFATVLPATLAFRWIKAAAPAGKQKET
jgi:predicted MFS family arabinose efflux permease